MKLVPALCLLGLSLGSVTAIVVGCGSDDTSSTTTGGGKQPPAPTGGATTGTDERTFAVYSLQLGETDRAGAVNRDAWKKFGYNLDGLTSNRDSKDVCTQAPGATKANQEDGDEGTDNAFGKVILPLLPITGPSKQLNDSIQGEGAFTILMRIKGLTDDANQSNTGLSGTLLVGGDLNPDPPSSDAGAAPVAPTRPSFTPDFQWPYRPSPQIPITGSYITSGVFVNGDPKTQGASSIELSLFLSGQALSLRINKPTITFKHQPPNDLVEGTIAGVIGTEELISSLEKVAGNISETFCGGTAFESIKSTIRQASDMIKDGTNRGGVPCDGISVGIGFTAKRVANPTKEYVDNGVPAPNLCADAGQ